MSARVAVAESLEQGKNGRFARVLSAAYASIAARGVVKRLDVGDARVVAIGGATLGGSGKTPLAIACVESLAARGARVAYVGHAYRAAPRRARVVTPACDLATVGDEALLAARALGDRARVVVAPTRQAAVDLARTLADVLVLDGVLQLAPRRAALALLALDASSPWGSGHVPPRGDLRAPRESLLAACDRVVPVGEPACTLSRGAFLGGALVPWSTLATLRVGLVTALARPSRVLAHLAHHGVTPAVTLRAPDHGPFSRAIVAHLRYSEPRVALWLATPKCALQAAELALPLAIIDRTVALDSSLESALWALARPSSRSPALTPRDHAHYSQERRNCRDP